MITKKDYTFVTAVCRSNEKKLLGKERIGRMLNAESLSDAFKILRETPFGGDENTLSCVEYEKLITAEQRAFNAFLRENAPDAECYGWCLYPSDFDNCEAIVKCAHNRQDYGKYVGAEGAFSYETLEKAAEKGCGELPTELNYAIKEAENAFAEKIQSGMKISAVFTKAKFECLKRVATSKALKNILAFDADARNISVALRARKADFAEKMYVAGGTLNGDDLAFLCERTPAEIKHRFRSSLRAHYIADAADALSEGRPFVSLEQAQESVPEEMLSGAKYEISGKEPFLLYYYTRKNEIFNARVILTGKANGLEKTEIRRRIAGAFGGENER